MKLSQEKLQTELEKFRKNERKKALQYILLACIGIGLFLTTWKLIVEFGIVSSKALPAPDTVWETFLYKLTNKSPDGNVLGENILASLEVAFLGFTLAAGIGIPLGLFMGWFRAVDKFIAPVFSLMRPIPPIAWIPVVVILAGVDIKARAIIIFLSVFIPCVMNSYTGIKQTNPTLINVSKTFGAGNFETFWKVGVPSAMPMVFTGARLAVSGAWSTLVAAEMLASNAGLGSMLSVGRNVARPDIVVLGMVVIGIMGAMMTIILGFVEKHVLNWKIGG